MVLYLIRNSIIYILFIYSCHWIYLYILDIMTVPIIREYSKDKNESKYNEYNDKPLHNDEPKVEPDNNMKNELSNFLSKLR